MIVCQLLAWVLLAFDFRLNLAAYPCTPVAKKVTPELELLCGKRCTKETCDISDKKCSWKTCCKGTNGGCKTTLNPKECATSTLPGGCIWDCDGDLVDNLVDPKDSKTNNRLYKSVKYVGQRVVGEADRRKKAKHKKRKKKNVHKIPTHNAWEYVNGISMRHVDAVGIIYRAKLNAAAYFKPDEIKKYKEEIEARKKKPTPVSKLQIEPATATKIEGILEKKKLVTRFVDAILKMHAKEMGTEKRTKATSVISQVEQIKMKQMPHTHKLKRQTAIRGEALFPNGRRRRLAWDKNDWKDATSVKQYVPFSSIGVLRWTCDPTAAPYEGTGAIVYKKDGYIYILTAGHNCWDDDETIGHKASTAIIFALNYNDPVGKINPFLENMETHSVDYETYAPEYELHSGTVISDLQEYTYDWCVVKIKSNPKVSEPALRMYYDNQFDTDVDLFLGAYSIIPKPPPIFSENEYYLVYLDNEAKSTFKAMNSYYKSNEPQFTVEGLSGTPWVDGYDKRTIVGIHVGEEDFSGTARDVINRITQGKFRTITAWIGMNKDHNVFEGTNGGIEYGWTNPGDLIGYLAKEEYNNVYDHDVYDDFNEYDIDNEYYDDNEFVSVSRISNHVFYDGEYLKYVAIGGLVFVLLVTFVIICFIMGFVSFMGLTYLSQRLKPINNQ